jgi:hypothetical protein
VIPPPVGTATVKVYTPARPLVTVEVDEDDDEEDETKKVRDENVEVELPEVKVEEEDEELVVIAAPDVTAMLDGLPIGNKT